MYSRKPDENSDSSFESPRLKISELKRTLEAARGVLNEKESKCKYLRETLEEISTENSMLTGALTSSVPDPPNEDYAPIVEVMPSNPLYPKNLISDVGSTGNLLKHSEESKALHYPSPDPHENLLHQSTGETMQVLHESDQGAATPPNEILWSEQHNILSYEGLEESKDPGTPKRDNNIRNNSSGSSTPHRYTDSVHRVHNLLIPNSYNPSFEDEGDFFTNLTRESREKRKAEPINKSLFD
jgi:hypothetical protein